MPIFEQTYRRWEGKRTAGRFRWLVISVTGIRSQFGKLVKFILFSSAVSWLFFTGGIIAFARLQESPEIMKMVKDMFEVEGIKPVFFAKALDVQTIIYFFLSLVAGHSLICDDQRNKALELYFSKPITRLDYFLGKLMIVGGYLAFVSLLPGLGSFALACLVSPEFLKAYYWIFLPITGYYLTLTISLGLMILAVSALSSRRRHAVLGALFVVFGSGLLQGFLYSFFPNKWTGALSMLDALRAIGNGLFMLESSRGSADMFVSAIYLSAFALVCAAILRIKVKPTEIIK